jgi:Basic region leucine zipper
VLYDSPPHPVSFNPTARAPATSSTALNHLGRRFSATFSPYQNPRVRQSLSVSTNPTSPPSHLGYRPHDYARTVARAHRARTSSFPAPGGVTHPASSSRPPVPLFGTGRPAAMEADHHLAYEASVLDHSPGTMVSSASSSPLTLPDFHHVLSDEQIAALHDSQRDFPLFDRSFDSSPEEMFLPSTPQTVSPHELTLDPNPPSTALTHLSTPGMNYEHSPFSPNDSTLQTPASGGPYLLDEGLDASGMYSLFPDDSPDTYPMGLSTDSFDTPMSRTTSHEEGVTGMHASINGVKSRSRSKPLPAIETKVEDDPATAKRKRNTLAARKSREKKQSILSSLEGERDDLQALVAQWKHKAESSECRVQQLEAQLRQLAG